MVNYQSLGYPSVPYCQTKLHSVNGCEILHQLKTVAYPIVLQGLVNVPFWEYWTSPYSSHLVDHIPNGWVM